MKKEIFDYFVAAVCRLYRINKEQLVTKDRDREIATARQMVFYMCRDRSIGPALIKKRMSEIGFQADHAEIIRGIKVLERKISSDPDVSKVINRIINQAPEL